MNTIDTCLPDVMLVCRHGHVITDLLRTYPERRLSHCDRCGAQTLDRCLTCGQFIAGAIPVPGLEPIGSHPPPHYCPQCGAAFPWTPRTARTPAPNPLATLEPLLRRLPRVIRQLRERHGERLPLRIEDEHDLDDLLRSVLPMHFDDIRPESRTPAYAATTRRDLLLVFAGGERSIAVLAKRVTPDLLEAQLAEQLRADVAYYARCPECRAVVALVYDPEARLREPRRLETAWSSQSEELELCCVIAS
jgi:hypothetical protein